MWFDEPVTITSGIRPDHNLAVGGAPDSQHVHGLAADIRLRISDQKEVYRYLDTKYPTKYGIGLYSGWILY